MSGLLGRNWPDNLDRRRAEPRVDVDPTCPQRRATDVVIQPASDAGPMSNVLSFAALSQSRRRFLATPERLTAMGDLT